MREPESERKIEAALHASLDAITQKVGVDADVGRRLREAGFTREKVLGLLESGALKQLFDPLRDAVDGQICIISVTAEMLQRMKDCGERAD